MKCTRHPDVDAVGQCARCGAGVCSECSEKTSSLREHCGTLCVKCYCDKLIEIKNFYSNSRLKNIRNAVISGILYTIGLLFMVLAFIPDSSGPQGGIDWTFIIIGVVFCGVYTGLTWKKFAEALHDEKERREGITYIISDEGIKREDGLWSKVFYFVLGTVFGVILTPIKFVKHVKGAKEDKKTVLAFEEEINSL